MGQISSDKPVTEKSTYDNRFSESRGGCERGNRDCTEWAQEGDPKPKPAFRIQE